MKGRIINNKIGNPIQAPNRINNEFNNVISPIINPIIHTNVAITAIILIKFFMMVKILRITKLFEMLIENINSVNYLMGINEVNKDAEAKTERSEVAPISTSNISNALTISKPDPISFDNCQASPRVQ